MTSEPSLYGLVIGLLALVAATVVGCGSPTHADHLEHHVPAHRPHDLADAVEEIERRWPKLESNWATNAKHSQEELSELNDIIRWLPELAGDSDLPEAEWNKVNAISKSWQAHLAPLSGGSPANVQQGFPSWNTEKTRLAELQRMAPLAKTGHSHSHHGHSHD